MESKMDSKGKPHFEFWQNLIIVTLKIGVLLVFMIVLNGCSSDANFKIKEGSDNLRSVNQPKKNPSVLINNGSLYTDDPI